jgi:hypothetical protein
MIAAFDRDGYRVACDLREYADIDLSLGPGLQVDQFRGLLDRCICRQDRLQQSDDLLKEVGALGHAVRVLVHTAGSGIQRPLACGAD